MESAALILQVQILGHDPLEALIYVALLAGIVAFAVSSWKTKGAQAGAAAADTWQSVAKAYQEKLEQRDTQMSDMKAEHAHQTAKFEAEIAELRRQVEDLRARDQSAVIELIRGHESAQADRHLKTLDVLVEIRDNLKGGLEQ